MLRVALAATVAGLVPSASGVELTPENWDEKTAGKSVLFLKFYAPSCGPCQKMKPAWDKLMEEFADSPTLVGDVDCTAGGKPLCEKSEIGEYDYPTLKFGNPFGNPSEFKDYRGGMTFDDFKKFAGSFRPTCGPGEHLELCDVETKAKIEAYTKMSVSKIDGKIWKATKDYEEEMPLMKKVSAYLKKQDLAEDNLGPTCGPGENLELCDAETERKIGLYMIMGQSDKLVMKVLKIMKVYDEEIPLMKQVSAYLKKQAGLGSQEL